MGVSLFFKFRAHASLEGMTVVISSAHLCAGVLHRTGQSIFQLSPISAVLRDVFSKNLYTVYRSEQRTCQALLPWLAPQRNQKERKTTVITRHLTNNPGEIRATNISTPMAWRLVGANAGFSRDY